MAERSLKASQQGRQLAKQAFDKLGITQETFADKRVGCSRSTISKFFRGKPVDREIFVKICRILDLQLEEVIEFPQVAEPTEEKNEAINIDVLVQEVREKIKPYIQERCGKMQVLDMTQSIGLGDIYTDVNILKEITGHRRKKIAELPQNCDPEEFDRLGLWHVTEERVPGLEAVRDHSKLMVLGKPGAGKTTFLKHLAIQCIEGNFQGVGAASRREHRLPIFITLKDFAEAPKEPEILKYIALQLSKCNVKDAKVKVEQLLRCAKVLVLLDGLDEVREEDTKRVLNQVQEFSNYFPANQFVITCRIAASEYTFQGFTQVEVADFNFEQIKTFAKNWFRSKQNPVKGERFIQKLEENEPIQELASNPLLLTLLCLVFGEAGNFPINRPELYKQGLDVLLKKWDATRNIEREQVYKHLSLQRKEDLLSQIALTTFEQKEYFFNQEKVEAYIADFISNLLNARTEPKELELDSKAVLKSIEAQHGLLVARATGIYSFSHLTFQEYFAAREIVTNSVWKSLVEHITEKRWREVFLLTAGMMRKADDLVQLMKQKIDGLLAGDEKLQQFLTWVKEKSESVEARYKPATVRDFYFSLSLDLFVNFDFSDSADLYFDFNFYQSLSKSLDLCQSRSLSLYRSQSLELSFSLCLSAHLGLDPELLRALNLNFLLDHIPEADSELLRAPNLDLDHIPEPDPIDHNPELKRSLQQLKDQLPNSKENLEAYKHWWEENGQAWAEQLRAVMIKHRNIGHDWQFSESQKELLKKYYDANKLLVDCLNSDCYVSREVRQKIEDELLLAIAEIKKRQ
ncbi:MAG: signal transduction protein [Hapalosiphonaceae cyanobacterium JJU2]|nr:MAG: signal transduction protein [Hapalosiphonaceae cyanobacterium JJU2]